MEVNRRRLPINKHGASENPKQGFLLQPLKLPDLQSSRSSVTNDTASPKKLA
jgi:hypothetical protein